MKKRCWTRLKTAKVLATAKQLIRKNSICYLKNQAFLFHKANVQIGLTTTTPAVITTHSYRGIYGLIKLCTVICQKYMGDLISYFILVFFIRNQYCTFFLFVLLPPTIKKQKKLQFKRRHIYYIIQPFALTHTISKALHLSSIVCVSRTILEL